MMKSKILTLVGLGIGLFCFSSQASADEKNFVEYDRIELEDFTEDEMPEEAKDVILNVPFQNDIPMRIEDLSNIAPAATTAIPGNSTQDITYSKTFGTRGLNQIYTKVDSQGIWSGLAFHKFSGWGLTSYSGSEKPAEGNVKSKVRVKAYGLIPNISIDGSKWGLLGTSRQIGSDSNSKNKKYAQAYYSNVKIQKLTGVNAIFYNESYIKVPSGLNDTWTEDTYVWF